jgi:hypothetical protein
MKYFSRGLEALGLRQGDKLQPANLLSKFLPKTGTNHWFDTCLR